MGGAMAQAGLGGGGAGLKQRNPIVTMLIAISGFIAVNVIVRVLLVVLPVGLYGIVGLVGNLMNLAGYLLYCFVMFSMVGELQRHANDSSFPTWGMFVPIWGWILGFTKVRELITQSRQRAGLGGEARNIALYIFLAPFALAADINDLAGGGAPQMQGAPPGGYGAPGGFGGGY
jgi:hypothetical protein